MFTADDREAAREILQKECGNDLPFLNELDEFKLERYRFAALKLSGGDLAKLREVVTLAKRDWRDLVVAAGFAHDIRAHEIWIPEIR